MVVEFSMTQEEKEDLISQVLTVIEESKQPVDISHVATKLDKHWYSVYVAIMNYVLDKLQTEPILFKKLLSKVQCQIIPEKTTKSIVVRTWDENYKQHKKLRKKLK